MTGPGNAERFSGFADLYDRSRPTPPTALGPLLARYARLARPVVVDLGSGSGASSRWAATWAASVTGIEPNDDMRAVAESRPAAGVTYTKARAEQTGLADRVADVVLAVQSMHWMAPGPTLAEVARILRPGGVLAVVDADWPPVAGVARAEQAWTTVHRRLRVFDARVARGETGQRLRRPIAADDPALVGDDLADPHCDRQLPEGVRSWAKSEHLARMTASGAFGFTRELLFDQPIGGGADRFVDLLHSQGSYQTLRRLGLSDQDLGAAAFADEVRQAFADAPPGPGLSFSWRARLGVTVPGPPAR